MTTVYILLLSSFGYVATDIYLPSLPSIAAHFGADERGAQLTIVAYLLSFSATPLVFGPLSDSIGRKKVIVMGMAATLIATLLCLFAPTMEVLIAGRLLQGIGAGAVVIAARALVVDLYNGKELARQISYLTMMMPFILTTAPILGGFLQTLFGWRCVFLFLTFYAMGVFIWSLMSKETLATPKEHSLKEVMTTYKGLLNHPSFLYYAMGIVLPSAGAFIYVTVSPFLFQNVIGLNPAEYGLLAIWIGMTIMAAGYLNAQLLHRFQVTSLIRVGFSMIVLGGLLLLFFHFLGILTTWSLMLPVMVFFSCMSFGNANSSAKAMEQISRNYGSAHALIATAQFLFGAMGSFVFSLIPETDALPLALSFIFIGLAAFGFLHLACRHEKKKQVSVS